MNFPAVIQTAVITIALWRCHRYPAFLTSLAAALPFLWITPDMVYPHAVWERSVWLPCAIVMVPMQAVAAMEACLRFGDRYQLAARVSATLLIFAVAGAAAFWIWPAGTSAVAQVVRVARYQRVGCFVFLVAAVAFYSLVRGKDLIARRDGAHLILCAAWAFLWLVPTIQPTPPTWGEWLTVDWMLTARSWVLVAWVGLVALRKPNLYLAHPLV